MGGVGEGGIGVSVGVILTCVALADGATTTSVGGSVGSTAGPQAASSRASSRQILTLAVVTPVIILLITDTSPSLNRHPLHRSASQSKMLRTLARQTVTVRPA